MNIESQVTTINQTTATAAAVVQSMLGDLEYDKAQLADVRADFERMAKEGASDDEMDDLQEVISDLTRKIERSELRYKAAMAGHAKTEGSAKADLAKLHHEAGNGFLAQVMSKQKDAALLAGQLVEISEEISKLMDQANTHRREAKALGIAPINPGMPTVDITDALAALKRIAGASGTVWFGLYS